MFMMKHQLPTIVLLAATLITYGQPNCNLYKMNGDEACYNVCITATTSYAPQGSRESQLSFDKALALCPAFDYAYFEKAVPYLKRGEFVTWKLLIDKAVELNPTGRLGYRGWCRYQFLRDYEGAIADFEKLQSYFPDDIGYSQNGDYHLMIAMALCYKALGQKQRAIEIIEAQLQQSNYSPMLYDYLHLGVSKLELQDYAGAIAALGKSIVLNDYLADNYYYLALAYRGLGNSQLFTENMLKALAFYQQGRVRRDPYTHPMDKVFLSDIETALAAGK